MFSKNLFCSRLKSLRLENNLTLEQLGAIFGVTKQAASRWETGDRLPSIEIVYMLAEYFNVSLDYLTGRADDLDMNIINIDNTFSASTSKEKELLENFRSLDNLEQNVILGKISEIICNNKLDRNEVEISEELVSIEKSRLNK